MQAPHRADLVRQPAGNADAGIAEVVEQADQPGLQAAGERGVADAGDVLHRALADALAHAAAAHRVQFRVEGHRRPRSEEHKSELQSLMRISYAVFSLKNKNTKLHSNATHTCAKLSTEHELR